MQTSLEIEKPPARPPPAAPPQPGPELPPGGWPRRLMSSRLYELANTAGLAVVYFLAAKLGDTMASPGVMASPVGPPAGIALAVLLLLGYRVWPGILLGAFVAHFTAPALAAGKLGLPATASLGMALGE